MSFTIYENDVILCTGENLLTHDLSSDTTNSFSLPKLAIDDNQKHHNNADMDAYHGITTIFTSTNGEYLGVCTNRKQLCVYERPSRRLILNRTLARAASRARFTPDNDIIVADKSGDLYLYENSENSENSGKLILGHLSMLLDCLVTRNNRHVITTDRDEKIRVSCFPNAYNIVSYCLGHEKFVTAVKQLPQNEEILVSAGGDGQLKFWHYIQGKELLSFDFSDKIPAVELETLNESLKCFELTESVKTLPVKHLRIQSLDEKLATLILSFYSSKRILVYFISKNLELRYSETLILEQEPLECVLRKNELWILDDEGLQLYTLEDDKFKVCADRNKCLASLNDSWSVLRRSANKQSLYPILYKRKFDNVQEYQERKKSRLAT
ncbi:tRNA (guanine-N(7)-)-methyltransferase non-catalytic subunit wdr4 [Venturia canescens]|uniref:tRNA (guanine-N(7)-)-methyltransferase non-catalytic subunit wdr4 n=1 Tax=Venturia canescens TaxID=32260 RepID=UPI001C9D4DFC|nr:tRNA (guanine-N(7)-)-methyltransferase non-catalytic subunit wdr4 [Venturia canescens]